MTVDKHEVIQQEAIVVYVWAESIVSHMNRILSSKSTVLVLPVSH